MTKLNEYIGGLVNSITNARVMSDIQTVKVAEEYAKHDLLKHFSIPRMKIEDIEMTIPIALDVSTPPNKKEYIPLEKSAFNGQSFKEIVSFLEIGKLTKELSDKLNKFIEEQTNSLDKSLKDSNDIKELNSYLNNVIDFLSKNSKDIQKYRNNKNAVDFDAVKKHLGNKLKDQIRFSNEDQSLDNLNVIIEAHKLKDQKPENLIYIKLKISESGMEWDRTENNDGKIISRLLPE